MSKNVYALNLDSDAFNSLKTDFNQILRQTLSTMLQKEGEKAELKLSLKITLTEGMAPDLQEHKYESEREIIIPKFDHKISSVMQYKDEKSGHVGGAEYELVWDKDSCTYVMRPIKDAQMNLFDAVEDESYSYEEEETDAEA